MYQEVRLYDDILLHLQTTVTEENVEQVAKDLVVVTFQIEDSDETVVGKVAESLESIVDTNTSSPEVTDAFMGTVNNLMNFEAESLQTTSSNKIISLLEQQISLVQQDQENFTEVQDNLAVVAVKLDPQLADSITFFHEPDEEGGSVTDGELHLMNTINTSPRANRTSIFIHGDVLQTAMEGGYHILYNVNNGVHKRSTVRLSQDYARTGAHTSVGQLPCDRRPVNTVG
ncbi:putative G-protein coupled receptor [Apostichopus japonicus]|uniref:Putative G-protein coupled receptor n=1 Tax=Stichopus japonicus TaxID=307972 RepID=A0A2G8JDB5_STIJA|nr:putative G-protein coupled receptor [Apostichopus japonicus]